MAALFGGKRERPQKTILILDIENGSVASALVRVSEHEAPKLFGEVRKHLPVVHTRDGNTLMTRVTQAARSVLRSVSETAARIRQHPKASAVGKIDAVAIFLAVPWGSPDLSLGKPRFMPEMQDFLNRELLQWVGHVPVSYHTGTAAGVFGVKALYPQEDNVLLYTLLGEVGELTHIQDGMVVGHATTPHGYGSVIRTLKFHGGMSEQEARSALHVRHYEEPLRAAGAHIADSFNDTARDMLGSYTVPSVFVLTHEPVGEWLAETLSQTDSIEELFPEGGTVRALRSHHAAPLVAAHNEIPDLSLIFASIFVDSHTL